MPVADQITVLRAILDMEDEEEAEDGVVARAIAILKSCGQSRLAVQLQTHIYYLEGLKRGATNTPVAG
ncbi:MAG: hypothetical protein HYT49_00775 [Candidatus Wildermuthbacteria bacterium]|nr:hypothetical protein [Candidatus Wildermuthbacteria bacterium]